MKKFLALLLAAAQVMLAGCSGSIYANYRAIEQMVLIQTVGYDLEKNGDVGMSVSSGKGAKGQETVRLSATAESVGQAAEKLQSLSAKEELSFLQASYIMLGENAANDAERFLDYVERSVQTRMDTPLIVVRGGTAAKAITGTGGEKAEITEVLSAIKREAERSGDTRLFTVGETACSLAESGAALCCAVKEIEDPNTGVPTVVCDGFAVLREGRLVGWVEKSCARGVTLMLGEMGGMVSLPSGVTVEITGAGMDLKPEWSDGGELRSLEVKVKVQAQVTELKYAAALTDQAVIAALEEELEDVSSLWVRKVLSVSRAAKADFMGLGRELEVRYPLKWEQYADEWPDALEYLTIRVTPEAEITRVRDMKDRANVSGGGD